jgi:sugar/nucleoside kinase (ribokinase family)
MESAHTDANKFRDIWVKLDAPASAFSTWSAAPIFISCLVFGWISTWILPVRAFSPDLTPASLVGVATLAVPAVAIAFLGMVGGKGANQPLAAARAGGDVTLIGCVGEDDAGTRCIEHLRSEGIHTGAIMKAGPSTGCAFITVDDAGENSIVVSPGANHALMPIHVDEHAALIRSAAALLLQLECPLPTVLHAIRIAAAAGVPVILNPSPLTPEFIQARVEVDTLILNAQEAAALVSMTPAEIDAEPHPTRTI